MVKGTNSIVSVDFVCLFGKPETKMKIEYCSIMVYFSVCMCIFLCVCICVFVCVYVLLSKCED